MAAGILSVGLRARDPKPRDASGLPFVANPVKTVLSGETARPLQSGNVTLSVEFV
ncbi:MAG: hypothetical protein NVSMB14_06660 [Isosphaeraceae bacterium]